MQYKYTLIRVWIIILEATISQDFGYFGRVQYYLFIAFSSKWKLTTRQNTEFKQKNSLILTRGAQLVAPCHNTSTDDYALRVGTVKLIKQSIHLSFSTYCFIYTSIDIKQAISLTSIQQKEQFFLTKAETSPAFRWSLNMQASLRENTSKLSEENTKSRLIREPD